MIALIDANAFFCSVEKVFHPGLDGKPVCVTGSNDGIIVALTPEAKAVGLHRGDPVFKVRDIVEHNNVTIFSTNMYLYAAMSRRINSILRSCVQRVDQYSIDEAFTYLDGYEKYYNIEEYMRDVVNKIKLWTDVPVSVGIAQSKTLAKMSSKFAKNYKGYNGVCMIDTEAKRRKALELFNLSDVWGIGRQTFQKLNYYGIHSALELANKKESWIRSHFNKAMVQTWMELNGIPCIDTSEVKQKQTICTSRSFGDMVTELDSLKSSVASFAASCANKLRGQDSVSGSITVFICSNNFRTDLEQYSNGSTYTFLTPTSDTIEITKAAMSLLEAIYRIGIHYKKAGVILGDICTALPIQQNLFDEIKNRPQRRKLMSVVDNINQRYGLKSLCLGVEGLEKQSWHVKSDHRSGNYLSDINEILTIRI